MNIRSLVIKLILDGFAVAAAWITAFALRFNFDIPPDHLNIALQGFGFILVSTWTSFWITSVYRSVWKFFAIPDLQRLAAGVLLATFVSISILFVLTRLEAASRAVWVLFPIILLLLAAGLRIGFRFFQEQGLRFPFFKSGRKRVLVLGAGDAAVSLLRELRSSTAEWEVVALLDDNPTLFGRQLYGVRVVGPVDSVVSATRKFAVDSVIIAMPTAAPGQLQRVTDQCRMAQVKVYSIPSWGDLIQGKVTISRVREVAPEELLGRGEVVLDDTGLRTLISGKRVLVTGAGGSIGSELCRRICDYSPELLVMIDQSEAALYLVEQEFTARNESGQFEPIRFVPVVGDVKNEQRMVSVFRKHQPTLVFHAAAYKHVPLMERENSWEAVQNNVFGTYTVGRVAQEFNVDKFILVSTDKAVNPVNVMGASKRLAELVCQELNQLGSTRFVTVRFGNVLGSQGSVIPKFKELIAKGGPIPVTHPEMIRYFMSIPEAAQLVMQAGLLGTGGEIFILEMGTPVKILDLAKMMIRLSGLGEEEIPIVFTGLRPGEKLYEELTGGQEVLSKTPHPKLRVAKKSENENSVESGWFIQCLEWITQEGVPSDMEVRVGLRQLIPEYTAFLESSESKSVLSGASDSEQGRHS